MSWLIALRFSSDSVAGNFEAARVASQENTE
jgi:hypothetical protein